MGISTGLSSTEKLLATVKVPSWQSCDDEAPNTAPVTAKIVQNGSYGGISVYIGDLEVYIEYDAEKGIVVRVWPDTNASDDPAINQDFPLPNS